MSGSVFWLDIQDHCYGIVSLEVQYQEALIACTSFLDSQLARLPMNISKLNVLEHIDSLLYNVHINPGKNYWVSGKCKCAYHFGNVYFDNRVCGLVTKIRNLSWHIMLVLFRCFLLIDAAVDNHVLQFIQLCCPY